MSTVTGVITQVYGRWPSRSGWVVEVEVFADGRYHQADIEVLTERDAKAIQRGAEATIPDNLDDDSDPAYEIPF